MDLFDLQLRLPAGLAHWMSTDPTQVCDPTVMKAQKDPRYQAALTTWIRARLHSAKRPPSASLEPVQLFVVDGTPHSAHLITRAIMGLLRWQAAQDATREVVEHGRGIDLEPRDPIGTARLVRFAAALIALTDDVVVVNVETERFPDGVYVQLCREDDGALTLEAVSSTFLDSPLSPDEMSALESLGWQAPAGEGLPNYIRYLEPHQTSPGEVAEYMVRTLEQVYGTKPSDLHQFAPEPLVRSLLKGEHGREFAMNPALSEAQKSRLYRGLRFPQDLDAGERT
jgi:hypothetical protein